MLVGHRLSRQLWGQINDFNLNKLLQRIDFSNWLFV